MSYTDAKWVAKSIRESVARGDMNDASEFMSDWIRGDWHDDPANPDGRRAELEAEGVWYVDGRLKV